MRITSGRPRAAGAADLEPSDNPLRALVRCFGLLRRVMEPYFLKFGISASQWGVLRTLHRSEGKGVPALG